VYGKDKPRPNYPILPPRERPPPPPPPEPKKKKKKKGKKAKVKEYRETCEIRTLLFRTSRKFEPFFRGGLISGCTMLLEKLFRTSRGVLISQDIQIFK
jgi:hypothetical protein